MFTTRNPFAFEGDSATGGDQILAPMPGKIIAVEVAEGDVVSEGQTVMIMEAMKMELTLKAPRAGEIAAINAAPDDFVEADTPLVALAES